MMGFGCCLESIGRSEFLNLVRRSVNAERCASFNLDILCQMHQRNNIPFFIPRGIIPDFRVELAGP